MSVQRSPHTSPRRSPDSARCQACSSRSSRAAASTVRTSRSAAQLLHSAPYRAAHWTLIPDEWVAPTGRRRLVHRHFSRSAMGSDFCRSRTAASPTSRSAMGSDRRQEQSPHRRRLPRAASTDRQRRPRTRPAWRPCWSAPRHKARWRSQQLRRYLPPDSTLLQLTEVGVTLSALASTVCPHRLSALTSRLFWQPASSGMTAATRTAARSNRRRAAQHGDIGIAPVSAARSRLTLLFPAWRQTSMACRPSDVRSALTSSEHATRCSTPTAPGLGRRGHPGGGCGDGDIKDIPAPSPRFPRRVVPGKLIGVVPFGDRLNSDILTCGCRCNSARC